uniref:Uncharacterized protein n=1 Tax=Glossina pallidipes TaxID=7398 RepID=A0A1A9ZBF9_GLOPL
MNWQISPASREQKCQQNNSSGSINKKQSARSLQNIRHNTTATSVHPRFINISSKSLFLVLRSDESNVHTEFSLKEYLRFCLIFLLSLAPIICFVSILTGEQFSEVKSILNFWFSFI